MEALIVRMECITTIIDILNNSEEKDKTKNLYKVKKEFEFDMSRTFSEVISLLEVMKRALYESMKAVSQNSGQKAKKKEIFEKNGEKRSKVIKLKQKKKKVKLKKTVNKITTIDETKATERKIEIEKKAIKLEEERQLARLRAEIFEPEIEQRVHSKNDFFTAFCLVAKEDYPSTRKSKRKRSITKVLS